MKYVPRNSLKITSGSVYAFRISLSIEVRHGFRLTDRHRTLALQEGGPVYVHKRLVGDDGVTKRCALRLGSGALKRLPESVLHFSLLVRFREQRIKFALKEPTQLDRVRQFVRNQRKDTRAVLRVRTLETSENVRRRVPHIVSGDRLPSRLLRRRRRAAGASDARPLWQPSP